MNWNRFLPGLFAGFSAVVSVTLDLRRRHLHPSDLFKSPLFVGLDIVSTACVLGSAAWFIAVLLLKVGSGSPVLISSLAAVFSLAIFIYVWEEGRRANQFQRPAGIVLGECLVLAGMALTALRLIAGRYPVFDAQNIGSFIFGGSVLGWVVSRFLKKKEEHHIIERVVQQGEVQQPEYTPATLECPHPERWNMVDSMSAELEILDFLKQIVLTLKPVLIVETGTFIGASTIKMAEGLRANGFGKIITCEFDPLVFAKAKERTDAAGLGQWIEHRNQSSLDMQVDGAIDLFFSDSHLPIRGEEVRRFLPQIRSTGLILMHDTSSHFKVAREAAFQLEQEGLISMVLLPTPRGLMIAQKRSGRK